MKKSLLIISIFATTALFSQTKISVNAQSNSFTPSAITINVGDTVEWTNTGGNHNINGTTATFPSNPEGFGNTVGSGWTYSHVFNIAGFYDYKCDPHGSSGMTGTVTVQMPTGVSQEILQQDVASFYPNPASKSLNFSKSSNVIIYSLTGKQVLASNARTKKMDISRLNSGIYFVKIIAERATTSKKLIVQ